MDLFFDELENMATSAQYESPQEDGTNDPNHGTIKMWQERVDYTYEPAAEILNIVATTKTSTKALPTLLSPAKARTIYLLKLDGPLPEKVQTVANLTVRPQAYHANGEEGNSL